MAVRPVQGYYNLPRFIGEQNGITDEFICIPVFYPDNDAGKQLLAALLNIPTIKATWFTSSDSERVERAAMSQQALMLTYARWAEMEGCMNCSSLIECLSDETFLAALDETLAMLIADTSSATHNTIMSVTGSSNNTPIGLPPSDTYLNNNWVGGTNPTCDYDILYAQCLAVVVETNRTLVDQFEAIEAWSNAGEIAQILANLPVVAAIAEIAGVEAALGVIDKAIEFLAEGYIAGYTSDYEIAVACDLFCACKDDCEITAQRVIDVIYERVSVWGSFPVLGSLLDWVAWFNENETWGSAIVDVAFYAAWSAVKAMGTLFVANANAGVEMIIQRAANNPDGDWVFCTGCTTCTEYDLTTDAHAELITLLIGTYTASVGYEEGVTYSAPYYYAGVNLQLDLSAWTTVESVSITYDTTNDGLPGQQAYLYSANGGVLSEQTAQSGVKVLSWTGEQVGDQYWQATFWGSRDPSIYSGSVIVSSITICGVLA